MSDETSEENGRIDATDFPGLPPREFEAAIDALKILRDQGKYTIMLGRLGTVRLVGLLQDFRQSFSTRLDRDVETRQIEKALREIRRFCQATCFFEDTDRALHFIEGNVYDDEFKALDDDAQREHAREGLRRKLDLAGSLLPPASKHRQQRLRTATDACLEDVDIEVVRERQDELQGIRVEQPFLRLRIRYSDASGAEGLPLGFFMGPWGEPPFGQHKSFALEVDEVDIDVLLFRLREAKKRLASSVGVSASDQD